MYAISSVVMYAILGGIPAITLQKPTFDSKESAFYAILKSWRIGESLHETLNGEGPEVAKRTASHVVIITVLVSFDPLSPVQLLT